MQLETDSILPHLQALSSRAGKAHYNRNHNKLNAIFLGIAIFWSVTVTLLGLWNYWQLYHSQLQAARSSAYEFAKHLTLLDASHMTRQSHELAERAYGQIGHIRSLTPSRSGNAPDDWERKALQAFERGQKEVASLELLGNETYMRLMYPLVTKTGCLKCHAAQGYKIGDIQGGISIAILWRPFHKSLRTHIQFIALAYSGIWVIGILGLLLVWKRFQNHLSERHQAEERLRLNVKRLRKALSTTIQVMISAVETRDPYTAGHQLRVASLARAIATEMGLPQEQIEGIRIAGSIHDIGKLSIPAEILSKPTKLSDIEFSLIKEHARKGYEMLKNVESSWPLAKIVYQHHERLDGSGYPQKLKGDEILMEARILNVADVVEAMASHRPYRPSLGIDAALNEIEKNRGIFYDNAVADACLRLFREKGFQLEGT